LLSVKKPSFVKKWRMQRKKKNVDTRVLSLKRTQRKEKNVECKHRHGLGEITVMYSAIQHPTMLDRREKRHKERVRPRVWKKCCCHTLLFDDTQERTLKLSSFTPAALYTSWPPQKERRLPSLNLQAHMLSPTLLPVFCHWHEKWQPNRFFHPPASLSPFPFLYHPPWPFLPYHPPGLPSLWLLPQHPAPFGWGPFAACFAYAKKTVTRT